MPITSTFLVGATGDTGPAGIRGPEGPQGEQGERGASGLVVGTDRLVFPFITATIVWSAMQAALTEYRNATAQRRIMDLSRFSQVRFSTFCGAVAGAAGAELRLMYSTDSGSSWKYFDSTGANSGPKIAVDGTAGTPVTGSWVVMDLAARTSGVWVAVWGINGNGVTSPQFGALDIEFMA